MIQFIGTWWKVSNVYRQTHSEEKSLHPDSGRSANSLSSSSVRGGLKLSELWLTKKKKKFQQNENTPQHDSTLHCINASRLVRSSPPLVHLHFISLSLALTPFSLLQRLFAPFFFSVSHFVFFLFPVACCLSLCFLWLSLKRCQQSDCDLGSGSATHTDGLAFICKLIIKNNSLSV